MPAAANAAGAGPAQPEMPGFSMPPLSKVVPLILMMSLNKFDLDKLGFRQHCEAAFFGVQVGCYFALMMIEQKIKAKQDDPAKPKIKIPAEMVMGNEAKPAQLLTEKEYDAKTFSELRTQQLMVRYHSTRRHLMHAEVLACMYSSTHARARVMHTHARMPAHSTQPHMCEYL